MNEKTSKQWMEIVKPVAGGLVALMAAASLCLQQTDSTSVDARLTAVEVEVKNIQPWRGKVDSKIDNFEFLLSEIRSDVSFMRGKMEAGK